MSPVAPSPAASGVAASGVAASGTGVATDPSPESEPGWRQRAGVIALRTLPLLLVAAGVVLLLGLHVTLTIVAWVIAGLFVAFFLRHLLFAATARESAQVDMDAAVQAPLGDLPSVTVLSAMKDEVAVAGSLVDALLRLEYPAGRMEIVVVDDGSTDGTAELLDDLAAQHPRLRVVHRPPGSPGAKSGALNAGVAGSSAEVYVVFDADHEPHPLAVQRLVATFDDPRVGAVMGRTMVRNGGSSWLAELIAIDYTSGYLVNEYGRQAMAQLPAYGGSNCAVRAAVLAEVGGWNEDSVTEDTDLTVRAMLRGWAVRYDPAATDAEEAVDSIARFFRQRTRWAVGHQQVCRELRWAAVRCPHLTWGARLELFMFLHVYHMPVVAFLGLLLIVASLVGYGAGAFVGVPLAALLMLGPLLELGTGLTVRAASRRHAPMLLLFLPMFVVFMVACTRAWLQHLVARRYTWAKTQHVGHTPPAAGSPRTGPAGSSGGAT